MRPFDNILKQSLDKYIQVLENVGYVKESDPSKLVVLGFIEEYLEEYWDYITEKDYNTISKIVSCFADSTCLIPYNEFKQLSIPLTNYIYNIPIRTSENTQIRNTEVESALRLVNQ